MPIPPILLRILPHALVVLAILGGLAFVYHKGAAAMAQKLAFEREVQARITVEAVRRSEGRLIEQFSAIDTNLGNRIRAIDAASSTIIQPTIEREVSHEIRFSDPAAGLSPGLLAAVNAARELTCATAADGSVACPVPAAAADH